MSSLSKEKPGSAMSLYWNYLWPVYVGTLGLRGLHYAHLGRMAQIKPGDQVLELGSGDPWYKLYSKNVGAEGQYVALDILETVQKRAEKISQWIGKPSTESRVIGSAARLPFNDHSFDLVLSSNLIAPDSHFKESLRVLKPGGKLISCFAEVLGFPSISLADQKHIKDLGFSDIRVYPGMPAPPLCWNWYLSGKKPL